MEKIAAAVRERAQRALATGEVERVFAWRRGEFWYDVTPAVFETAEEVDELLWDSFCVANLSKYLSGAARQGRKIGVFVKGCDALAFNQLLQDNRISRDNVLLLGLPCPGMVDPDKLKKAKLHRGVRAAMRDGETLVLQGKHGDQRVEALAYLYDKCQGCRHPNPVVYDELLAEPQPVRTPAADRFAQVAELEALSAEEKFLFWQAQFDKCIRCNACRNICPACSCEKCIFDNGDSGVAAKANADACEEQFFHLIRAYHVAGRCVDCGECSRVCPAGIPIHLLNRKIIKDIQETYGDYEAGLDPNAPAPLVTYRLDDADPFDGHQKGGKA